MNYRTQSYETSPYANRKVIKRKTTTQLHVRHQNIPLHNASVPTQNGQLSN